jgi:hypothetical protein
MFVNDWGRRKDKHALREWKDDAAYCLCFFCIQDFFAYTGVLHIWHILCTVSWTKMTQQHSAKYQARMPGKYYTIAEGNVSLLFGEVRLFVALRSTFSATKIMSDFFPSGYSYSHTIARSTSWRIPSHAVQMNIFWFGQKKIAYNHPQCSQVIFIVRIALLNSCCTFLFITTVCISQYEYDGAEPIW